MIGSLLVDIHHKAFIIHWKHTIVIHWKHTGILLAECVEGLLKQDYYLHMTFKVQKEIEREAHKKSFMILS